MVKYLITAAGCALVVVATAPCASAQNVRTGDSAYGDWQTDTPGVTRKITPADLPAPLTTPSTANRSKVVAKPDGAEPKTMPGFAVTAYVTGLPGARVLRMAPNGDIFLTLSRPEGKIVTIRSGADMGNPQVQTFATGQRDAYGIAFYPPGPDPQWVYIGEYGKVVRFPYRNGDLTATGPAQTVVSDLATGGNHWTRDVAFSPDGKTMYVAVGSASNVAEQMGPPPADFAAFEKAHSPGSAWDREEWRANVLTYDPEGKNKKVFASGVRNCSGLAVQPGTGVVYCATNERDLLGDNLPPDYVTSVKQGAFYGWPWYYIGNHVDTRPGGGPRPDLADKVMVPDVLIQPHSAPLGIAFNPGGQFPPDWKGDAFVALHGSWNRALRTGYKIVRLPFRDGKPTGEYQDFVVGFVKNNQEVWGRPVDAVFAKDGSLLFS
ncbi:MAG: PQQ-dependent sugar dehydrogenase, partial [Alphaproteobacteria bacterium]|nr:PQQ-dependent sugar dehydrogenase [Alphaproteobacteria bacterium]